MNPLGLENYLIVGAILFALGLVGFITRRTMIILFLCAEMMVLGIAVNLTAFARYHGNLGGQVLTLPSDTRILPGHGGELTVAMAEKRFDSWVAAGQNPEAFVDLGPPLDQDDAS